MEENPIEPVTPALAPGSIACQHCGKPAAADNHPARLCPDCRRHFLHYPIPLWVKLFMGGVLVIAALSMYSFPKNLSISLHLERGKKAEMERRYLTAQQELETVVRALPGNIEARGHLLIAAYYNMDFATAEVQIDNLKDADFEDDYQDLGHEIDETAAKFEDYGKSDSLEAFFNAHSGAGPIPDSAWKNYFARNPGDVDAWDDYARTLEGRMNYLAADSIEQKAIAIDPGYFYGLAEMAKIKSKEGNVADAIACCDRILMFNRESVFARTLKVHYLIVARKEHEALELARGIIKAAPHNNSAKQALILACHFNGLITERDELIRSMQANKADSNAKETLQYALDVIDKKEKL